MAAAAPATATAHAGPFPSAPPAGATGPSVPVAPKAILGSEQATGYRRLLRIGTVVALVVAVADGLTFRTTGEWYSLLFGGLAVGAAVCALLALRWMRRGHLEHAVALPLVYLILIGPIGPALQESRVFVSIALPFIVMAVAMNYASVRYLRAYGAGAWVCSVLILAFWHSHLVARGTYTWGLAAVSILTASVLIAFTFYAFSRYSHRLHHALQGLESANRQISDAHARLQGVNQARKAFMNSAAHELNTPLTPIRMQTELLKRSLAAGKSEDALRHAKVLERNFDRLGRLVGDLLDGARLDSGKLRVEREEIDVSALLTDTAEEYIKQAESNGIRLETHIEPGLLVEGDPLRLRQVLDNLLTNALKFTATGGTIRVQASSDAHEAVLLVRDDGLGMDHEALAGLFQPFRQVHDTSTWNKGGTGLGLYIAKGIVERHHGTITATSGGFAQGSTFIVRLPLRAPAHVVVPAATRATAPPVPPSPSPSPGSPRAR